MLRTTRRKFIFVSVGDALCCGMAESESGVTEKEDEFAESSQRLRETYEAYSAPSYQQRWAINHPANRLMQAERIESIRRLLLREGVGLSRAHVLDFGCGTGGSISHWVQLGVSLERVVGVDPLLSSLASAPEELKARMVCGMGHRLPFQEGQFDVVSLFTVLSSVLDDRLQAAIAEQILRVLAPAGRVVCYDMRIPSPTNRQVRPVTEKRLRRLFPGAAIRSETLTVLPPISRRLATSPSRYRRMGIGGITHSHRMTVITPAPA